MSALLEAALAKQVGFMRREGWDAELQRALAGLVERHGLPSDSASDLVAQRSPLVRELAEELAVSESYFFRGLAQLERACARVAEVVQSGRRARVWSAGCSRGEEPYSLLALLHERHSPQVVDATEISGTDLSNECVEQARLGRYTEWSLRGTSAALRARHFDPAPGQMYVLKPHLNGKVPFNRATIQEHAFSLPHESLDVVLFRNVGIYLNESTIRSILGSLVSRLRPGGVLLMAPTDPLPLLREYPSLVAAGVGVFERKEPDAEAVLPWPLSVRPATMSASLCPPAPPMSNEQPEILEALAAADAGELREALRRLDAVLRRAPENARARFVRGQVLFADEQFRLALAEFRAVEASDATDVVVRYYQALCWAALGEARQAVSALQAIEHMLADKSPRAVITDGCTRDELLAAVRSELRRLL